MQRQFGDALDEYVRRTDKDVDDACKEMVQEAKAKTPPRNGEDRGRNTVTGDLAASWGSSYKIEGDTIEVTLTNDIQYASYVDQGHRMDRHFVPWLYVDAMGAIARKIPQPGEQMFGLVVGTKTTQVKPYNMTKYAKKRFFEAYSMMQSDTLDRIGDMLNGNND